MKTKTIFFIVFIFAFILFAGNAEAQCAMCKTAAQSNLDQDPNSVARGINKGILYLMAVPYLMLMFLFRKQIHGLWKKWRNKEAI